MNHAQLLEHFDRISEAPDAIARLRRFILDLAVRGKLVEQDPNDEPAAELLKRIQAEKVRLVKERKVSRESTPSSISKTDQPYQLPSKWEWVRLGAISASIQYGYTASADSARPVPKFVRITDIHNSRVNWETVPGCDIEADKLPTYKLEENDFLIARTGGTIGKSFLVANVDFDSVFASYLIRIRTFPLFVFPQFLKCYLDSRLYWEQLYAASMGTGQPNVNGKSLSMLKTPLPPLAEQHRIVAKVDELMTLCDKLEAAKAEREGTCDRMVASSLQRLNQPSDDEDIFRDDARFIFDNLSRLTTRPAHIKQLRQTILNLAVRGKLVFQDPNDEPATELLKRIIQEIPTIKAENNRDNPWPFDVPENWAWVHLGRLVAHSDSGWSPKTEDHPRTGDEWGILKVSAVSWDKFRSWENKQILPGMEPRLQAEVKQGDFLISRANTAELIARAVIVDEEPINLMMSDKIVRLRLSRNCSHKFVWIVNNYAGFSRQYYMQHASGVSPSMKNVSRNVILTLPFPLPPLAEQYRIVFKVDELMALCDKLEAQLITTEANNGRLLEALLYEALPLAEEKFDERLKQRMGRLDK